MDLRDLAENPALQSQKKGFWEQMRVLHDLLRQKPASLFILLG
jgi:hypothetical protein